jgi:hypothetical protein
VRNNFVTRAPENGIVAHYTRDCRIVHNTIHDPANRLGRLIRLVHDNDGLLVSNNLLSGPPIRNESASRVVMQHNMARDFSAAFADGSSGNLHLKAPLRDLDDEAAPVEGVFDDIDRQHRGVHPDIGADEME